MEKRNGIDLPFLTINFKRYDISKLVYAELLDVKTILELSVADIDRDISEAKMNAHYKKEFSDPTWFANINRLAALRKEQRKRLDIEIGKRRRERNPSEARIIEYWFMRAAESALPDVIYATILDEAKRLKREDEE